MLRLSDLDSGGPGWVYCIGARIPHGPTYTKIGYTQGDPMVRLRQISTGCPVAPELLGYGLAASMDVELDLHADLASYRKNGEWFELPNGLQSHVYGKTMPALREMDYPAFPFFAVVGDAVLSTVGDKRVGQIVLVDDWGDQEDELLGADTFLVHPIAADGHVMAFDGDFEAPAWALTPVEHEMLAGRVVSRFSLRM